MISVKDSERLSSNYKAYHADIKWKMFSRSGEYCGASGGSGEKTSVKLLDETMQC